MQAPIPYLFEPPPAGPPGLIYQPEFLSVDEEAELAARIAALPFAPFEFHGFTGNRRTVSYGLKYVFDGSGLQEAEPIPDFILPLRARAARLAGREEAEFRHCLITEYAPGAGIGWHRDRPDFGDVAGVSLLAPARLRFRLKDGAKWQRLALNVAPRSAYLLTGAARDAWEHSIAPMEALRYSITLRTLRGTDPNRRRA